MVPLDGTSEAVGDLCLTLTSLNSLANASTSSSQVGLGGELLLRNGVRDLAVFAVS